MCAKDNCNKNYDCPRLGACPDFNQFEAKEKAKSLECISCGITEACPVTNETLVRKNCGSCVHYHEKGMKSMNHKKLAFLKLKFRKRIKDKTVLYNQT